MRTVRVVAVSLFASAAIMAAAAATFYKTWIALSSAHAFIAAAQTIAPSLDAHTAMGMTAFAVLLLASLGLGLTFGALVYEPLDAALSAFSQRMTAKLFPPTCSATASTSASIGRR